MFQNIPGELAALITACCWTITAISFESAGKRIGSLSVNLIRLVLACLFLGIYCAITRQGRFMPTDATGHAWLWLGLSGLVGFTIGDLCLFRAFVQIGARISMLLMALVPPMSAVIAWFLMDESLLPVQWGGMALTIAGVALVVGEKQDGGNGEKRRLPLTGLLLGLLAAAGQAGGLALSKYGMGPEKYDPFAATQIRVLFGIGGFSLLFFFIRWWPRVFTSCRNFGAMQRVGLGAFFGPFLGVSFSLLAVQHTETGVGATIMSITPILIIPAAIMVFKEKVSRRSLGGAILAVAGVVLLFLFHPLR